MNVTITALYAGLLAILYLALSINVILYRGRKQVGLGDNADPELARQIRAHANFAEYAPLVLLLLLIAELGGAAGWLLHLTGLALVAGRTAHAWCFVMTRRNMPLRVAGMALTFAALGFGALLCLSLAFGIGR